MSNYLSWQFQLTTYTPLHITSCQLLLPEKDFYLYKNFFYRIDYPYFLSQIPNRLYQHTIQQIQQFGIQSLISPIQKNTKLSDETNWKTILRNKIARNPSESFIQDCIPSPEIQVALQNAEIYRIHLQGYEHITTPIQAMYLDSCHRSFIPGSSIKGAIRTSLYLSALEQNPHCLDKVRLTWTNNGHIASHPLDREMTGADVEQPSSDIFRSLIVRDSNYQPACEVIQIYPVCTYNLILNHGHLVLGYKNPTRQYNQKNYCLRTAYQDQQTNTQSKQLDRTSTTISANRYAIKKSLTWEMIASHKKFLIDLILDTSLLHQIYNLYPNHSPLIQITPRNIIHALKEFGKKIAYQELLFAQTYAIIPLQKFYQSLLDILHQASDNIAYFPIGYGGGWQGKTIGSSLDKTLIQTIRKHYYHNMGKFTHHTKGCLKAIQSINIHHNICPYCRQQLGPDQLEPIEPFPKTRHVIIINSDLQYPPGWVKIESN